MRRQLPSLLIIFVFVSWFAVVSAASFAQSQSPAVAQPAGADASSPSPQPNAVPATPKTSAKVWTNDDIDGLRHGNNLSVTGSSADPKKVSTYSKPYSQEKDPAWYRKQLAPLNAEIEKLDPQIAKLKAFLSGENVSEPTTMHHQLIPTPQDQLKQMEAKRDTDEAKIDDLLDRARHNGIEPGALR